MGGRKGGRREVGRENGNVRKREGEREYNYISGSKERELPLVLKPWDITSFSE